MRPSHGRISLWPIGVIGAIVVLAVASVTTVVRLNSAPPKEFVSVRATAKGANPAAAQSYWDNAVQVIQWRYDRTSVLPVQPPAEFSPMDGKADGIARQAYWAKLREEWLKADNWHKTVTFDVTWMWHDAQSIWRGVHDWAMDHT